MDEKALVVGAMGLSIHEIQGADSIYNQLKKETNLHDTYHLLNRASDLAMKYNAALPPAPIWHFKNKNHMSTSADSSCGAVHAVIPSARGDGTEALLLAFPITPGSDTAALTLAIGVQAARHLSAVSWLAKDLVIVFLEVAGDPGTNTTARCSHTALHALETSLREMDLKAEAEDNKKQPLPLSPQPFTGLLQQGIILDIRTVAATEARLSVHGYNGQLPNLDLVVLTKKNLDFYTNFPHGVGVDVGGAPAVKTNKDMNTLSQRIRTAASFTGNLALGKPTGAHAALLHRGADALSIVFTKPESTNTKESQNSGGGGGGGGGDRIKDSDVILTARNALNAIEMIIRTCNNLHERLHHANALYVLIDADHFINVGACMVPPGLLLAALLILVAEYVPHMLKIQESGKKKKGAMMAVVVQASVILTGGSLQKTYYFSNNITSVDFSFLAAIISEDSGRMAQILSTILGGALVFVKIGSRWSHCLSSTAHHPSHRSTTLDVVEKSERDSVLHSFIGVYAIIVLIEAAALLLWRWALCFLFLVVSVPLLQILSLKF